MLQRFATETPDPPASDPLEALGRGWLVLRDCRLGRQQDGVGLTALIHPRIGVLLLDRVPARLPGAVEAFRARLEAARFSAIFPGELPVVHLCLAPRDHERLGELLHGAFAGQPALNLPGGDAWVAAVTRALTAEPVVPRPQSRRFRTRPHRRFAAALGRALGLGALALLAVAGVLVATGVRRPEAPPAAVTAAVDAAAVAPAPSAAATLSPQDTPPAEPESPPVPARLAEPPVLVPPDPAPAVLAPPVPVPPDPAPAVLAPPVPVPPDSAPAVLAPPVPVPPAGDAAGAGEPYQPVTRPDVVPPPAMPRPPPAATAPAERPSRSAATANTAGIETRSAASASRRPAAPRQPEVAWPAVPEPPPARGPASPGRQQPDVTATATLPPIAAGPSLPPPAAAEPEPPPGRCRWILDQVFEGVLLPEEEMRFFNAACVRRRR